MNQSPLLNRREMIAAGCRTIGALSLAGGAAAVLDGCAHVPASATVTGEKLMRVTYQVAGQIQPVGSAIPYYYFVVINLTNTPGDPAGPVPIADPPYGNAIAAPPATAAQGSQGFVGFIQYDSNSGAYGVYTCPLSGSGATATFLPATDVLSPTGFSYQGIPNSYVLPAPGSNTIDITIDLTRLLPYKLDTLATYVQVNIITYSSLPINSNQSRDYDAIGDGRSTAYGVQTLTTAQSGQSISSSQIPEPTGDVLNSSGQVVTSSTLSDVANIDLSSWLIQLL